MPFCLWFLGSCLGTDCPPVADWLRQPNSRRSLRVCAFLGGTLERASLLAKRQKLIWAIRATKSGTHMVQRIVVLLAIAAALLGLILYSQMRPAVDFVSGVIEADEIRLGSRVGGRIKSVLVQEGDIVSAAAPLIEFEPYDLIEREQQAIAELAVRDAELKRLGNGMREEEIGQAKSRFDQWSAKLQLLAAGPRAEEISAAENRLRAAEAELGLARREHTRTTALVQSRAVSKSELDTAEQRLDVANANVEVRKNELSILNAGARQQELAQSEAAAEEARLAWELAKKGFRTEEIEKAAAARDSATAVLEMVRRQKSELVIIAPADGYIDALDLQAGDLVAPNAPVMTLLASDRLWVRAYVPQRFLQLRVGQELRVTIDSWPNENFVGVVSFISHQAEFTPSNVQTTDERAKQVYRIRVTIPRAAEKLRAGMTANVWLPTAKAQK